MGIMKIMEEIKSCTKCKNEQSLEKFSVTKRNEDGSVKRRNSWCNSCRVNSRREKLGYTEKKFRIVDEINKTKECSSCFLIKSFDSFYNSKRGSAGYSTYCKTCEVPRYKSAEKSRIATKEYRKRNPERWKAMHRIHQFNRVSKIKATDDGTVTDDFLKSVYGTEKCFWCEEIIEEENRTLEHIVELSQGGLHSASNITMACGSCNSARKGKLKLNV